MLPKLSERAAVRCTSNITRFYPAWKQSEIRQSGEGLEDMEEFIELNTAHLAELQNMIAEGERVCIDAGWPKPDDKATEQPEPQVIEKVVEKIVKVPVEIEVEKIVYRDHPTASVLEELEAAKAKIDERPAPHEEPPAAIADLFQSDRPYAEQAKALQELWVKLGHQVMRNEATPEEIRKHERLSSEIEFINRHAFEGV